MDYSDRQAQPQKSADNGTPRATGAIVIAAMAILWAIRRGFRGISLKGF